MHWLTWAGDVDPPLALFIIYQFDVCYGHCITMIQMTAAVLQELCGGLLIVQLKFSTPLGFSSNKGTSAMCIIYTVGGCGRLNFLV